MNMALRKRLSIAVALILCILFLIKFGGARFLQLYVESGIGSCKSIPILCMSPRQEISNPELNRDYIATLMPYKFTRMSIDLPKGFDVTQQTVKKYYYKKRPWKIREAKIYVVYQPPGFFINLFPEVKNRGINDNYNFIKNVMYARINYIQGIIDTFFVIMKGIFTPDIGEQNLAAMVQVNLPDRKAFINYNLGKKENYFDCNVITNDDSFFKIYIRDKDHLLDLNKVLAIISTAKPASP